MASCIECVDHVYSTIKSINNQIIQLGKKINSFDISKKSQIKEVLKTFAKKYIRPRSENHIIDTYYYVKSLKHTWILRSIASIIDCHHTSAVKKLKSMIRLEWNDIILFAMLANGIERYNIIKFSNEVTIMRKRFDYWGIILKGNNKKEFVIEIDDISHTSYKGKINDIIKNDICKNNCISILRIDITKINKNRITYDIFKKIYDIISDHLNEI